MGDFDDLIPSGGTAVLDAPDDDPFADLIPKADDANPFSDLIPAKDAAKVAPVPSAPVAAAPTGGGRDAQQVGGADDEEYQQHLAAAEAGRAALFGPGSIVGGTLLAGQLNKQRKADELKEAEDILAKVREESATAKVNENLGAGVLGELPQTAYPDNLAPVTPQPLAEHSSSVAGDLTRLAPAALAEVSADTAAGLTQFLDDAAKDATPTYIKGKPFSASNAAEYQLLSETLNDIQEAGARSTEGGAGVPDPQEAAIRKRITDLEQNPESRRSLEDATQFLRDVSSRSKEDYGVDPSRAETIPSKLVGGGMSVVPALASGPLAPATIAGMMAEQGRKDAEASGATPAQEKQAFYYNAAIGAVSEALMGVPALLRSAKAVGMPPQTYRELVKTVTEQVVKSSAREGVQEGIEQTAQNLIANRIVGYDPTRGTFKDVPEAVVLGAAVGGPIGGVVQTAESLPGVRKATVSKLDSTTISPAEQAREEADAARLAAAAQLSQAAAAAREVSPLAAAEADKLAAQIAATPTPSAEASPREGETARVEPVPQQASAEPSSPAAVVSEASGGTTGTAGEAIPNEPLADAGSSSVESQRNPSLPGEAAREVSKLDSSAATPAVAETETDAEIEARLAQLEDELADEPATSAAPAGEQRAEATPPPVTPPARQGIEPASSETFSEPTRAAEEVEPVPTADQLPKIEVEPPPLSEGLYKAKNEEGRAYKIAQGFKWNGTDWFHPDYPGATVYSSDVPHPKASRVREELAKIRGETGAKLDKETKQVSEKVTGTKIVAQRLANAEKAFVSFAKEQGGLTEEQAWVALDSYKKNKAIKIQTDGQFQFTHGGFAERDVLRRAAGLEKQSPAPVEAARTTEPAVGSERKPADAQAQAPEKALRIVPHGKRFKIVNAADEPMGKTRVVRKADGTKQVIPQTYATEADAERAVSKMGKRSTFGLPPSQSGHDILDAVIEQGGINLSGLSKEERENLFPHKGIWRNALTTNNPNLTPDEVARLIGPAEENTAMGVPTFGDGDLRTMFGLIDQAIKSRRNLRDQSKAQESNQKTEERQAKAFEREVLTPKKGESGGTPASELKVGDVVKCSGEKFAVTDVDADTGSVTLEDGQKFGTQTVEESAVIYGKVKPSPDSAIDEWSAVLELDSQEKEDAYVEQNNLIEAAAASHQPAEGSERSGDADSTGKIDAGAASQAPTGVVAEEKVAETPLAKARRVLEAREQEQKDAREEGDYELAASLARVLPKLRRDLEALESAPVEETSKPAEPAPSKKLWQVTKEAAGGDLIAHREAVKQAVAEGKPVPDEVVEQYSPRVWADKELNRRRREEKKAAKNALAKPATSSKPAAMPEDTRAASPSGQPSPSGQEARERIVGTAIKLEDGMVVRGKQPNTIHATIIGDYENEGGSVGVADDGGFITSTGRFVSRDEATKISQAGIRSLGAEHLTRAGKLSESNIQKQQEFDAEEARAIRDSLTRAGWSEQQISEHLQKQGFNPESRAPSGGAPDIPKLAEGQNEADLLAADTTNTGTTANVTNEEAGTLVRVGGQVVAKLNQNAKGEFVPALNEFGEKLTAEQKALVDDAAKDYTKTWRAAKIREGVRKPKTAADLTTQLDMLEQGRSETPLFEQPKPDKIEQFLDKTIEDFKNKPGELLSDPLFIQSVGKPALRAALQVIRAAYRGGKAMAQAIEEGIAYLKANVKDLDEAKARDFFTKQLVKPPVETPSTEEPAPEGPSETVPPTPPEPTTVEPVRPPMPETTADYNEETDKLLAASGFEPIAKPASRALGEAWTQALGRAANDPQLGSRLIAELNENPRTLVDDIESGVLLAELADRKAEQAKAQAELFKAVASGDEVAVEAAKARLEAARSAVYEAITAAKATGTAWGRAGRFRQVHIDQDYSIVAMEAAWRSEVNKGEPLTNDPKEPAGPKNQVKLIAELHDRIAKAEAKLAEFEAKEAEYEAKRVFDEVLKEAKQEAASKKKNGSKIASFIHDQAAKAKARIIARRGKLFATVDPLNIAGLVDEAIIGADYIAQGVTKFADWSAKMLADFGERLKPVLPGLFEKSKEYHQSIESEMSGGKVKSAATPKDVLEGAKEGEALSQKLVFDLARAHVNAGVEGVDNVMKAVHADLLPTHPDLTEREVRDAFTGYGKRTYPSREEDLTKLREYKNLGRLQSQLEDAIAKAKDPSHPGPQKTGPQRDKATKAVRDLTKQVKETMRRLGITTTSPEQQIKTSLDAVKTRLRNQIEDLNQQIATKTKPEGKTPVPYDAEATALKAERDRLAGIAQEIFGKPEMTDEQRIAAATKALDRSIAEEDALLKAGILKRPAKESKTPLTPELEAKRAMLDAMRDLRRELAAAENPKKSPEERALEAAFKAARESLKRYDEMLKSGNLTPEARAAKFTPTDALETLWNERNAVREAVAELRREAQPRKPKEELARQAALKALDKRMAELDRRLKTGDFTAKPVVPSKAGGFADVQAKRAEIAAMNELYRTLKKAQLPTRTPEQIQLARDKKLIAKRTAELERRVKAGDYAPKAKRPPVMDAEKAALLFENAKAKEAYAKGLFEERLKQRSTPRKIFDAGRETLNTSRAILTSFDVSGVLRQGAAIGFAHPVRAAKSILPMLKAAVSEKVAFDINERIKKRPNAALYESSKLFLSDQNDTTLNKLEEQFVSRFIQRSEMKAGEPVKNALRKAKNFATAPIRASSRAYTSFLNLLRADSFDAMAATLGGGPALTPVEAKAIANFINVATGRGKIEGRVGSLDLSQTANVLNSIFFAPRYVLSRFQFLAGQPLYGGSARTRKLIASEYGRYLIGVGLVYALAMAAQDDDDEPIETDPTSSSFLKIRFGDTRLDPMSGLIQATVFSARELKAVKDFVSDSDEKPPQYGSGGDVAGRFLRSKLAPFPGAVADMLYRKDITGKPITREDAALHAVTPISAGDILKTMEEQGVPKGTALSLLSLFGMGVQTYEERSRK